MATSSSAWKIFHAVAVLDQDGSLSPHAICGRHLITQALNARDFPRWIGSPCGVPNDHCQACQAVHLASGADFVAILQDRFATLENAKGKRLIVDEVF